MKECGESMLPIATTSSGAVRIVLIHSRRVISRSSGFSSLPRLTVRGSSAIPQIGQFPGAVRTISGCIGHVHSVFVADNTVSGSKAIPHFGQGPGPSCLTSGHIGQTYARSPIFPVRSSSVATGALAGAIPGIPPKDTRLGAMGLGGAARILAGLASNFARHPAQQKKYVLPSCWVLHFAVAGSTFIPHTGSSAPTVTDFSV